MQKTLLLFVSFCLSFLVHGQQTRINFTEYELPNGLKVILHQDNTTPIIAVTVMYHVGSKNEDTKRTGFAHFFEHLLFEGSQNIGRGEYAKIVEGAGGELNANTTFDRTFYYEVLPSNQLDLGLYLESERMLHARIDQEGVNTQRNVIKEEMKQTRDNRPYGRVLSETMNRAFKVHPYKTDVIGTAEHLDAASLDEFIAFYKQFYVPNNAILSIAGDIDIEKTKQSIAKYFSEIPKGTQPIFRPEANEPPQVAEIRDNFYDNVTLPAVIQAYRIPAQGTEDYYALNLLTSLLSGGESSRFTKEIKDKQQKALYVGSFPLALEHPGIFIAFGIANMGVKPEDLETSMNTEITKVQNEPISDLEFQKLKNQIESEFVNRNGSVTGIAENLANYEMYFGDANLINSEIDRYNKVTKEDIQRVAKKYLTKENRVSLYYLPNASKPAPQVAPEPKTESPVPSQAQTPEKSAKETKKKKKKGN
ncbi:pitrilysin family protein [Xanthocytophaga agilis]|uniref:Pitrilysin family protein n=1 Tax=Xanthocytophaga agilis TaxID=3048010 RepID=A0AAE3QZM2_9BACT|nr:pitrilysin family protein [Xanthocytophaga agilis]MDJ1500999.1 pitrilysin family protein [Xanthocytophaga agilis]